MPKTSEARTQVQRLYALTDQLKVQLQVLEETQPTVKVEIRPYDGDDIDALAFVVLMQANRAAEEDLKAVMDQVNAITAQKKKVRSAVKDPAERGLDLAAICQLVVTLTKTDLDRQLDQVKADLDSKSELGETESLRLQMAMDRMSKMMTTLSNLLKKISCTSSQIIQNMK